MAPKPLTVAHPKPLRFHILRILFTIIILQNGMISIAQTFQWDISLLGFADNREYKSHVANSQTFFGSQFVPSLGVNFDSTHNLWLGASALNEFGSDQYFSAITPQIYYHYNGHRFDFKFGSFPKHKLFASAPRALYNDTLEYFRPNMNGLFWSFKHSYLVQSVYLDWTSRQTDTQRETFIMGWQGIFQYESVFLYNHIYMYHVASPAIRIPNDHVRDNGVAFIRLGYDATSSTPFDSLSFSIAGIQSYERYRSTKTWHTPMGIIIEAIIQYKGFGIRNAFYKGNGHNLDWGDPFYRLNQYNRMDVYFTPLHFQRVTGRFGFSFHFAEGRISHQQQFSFRVNLNSNGKK